jgi:hypothetical protein
MDDHMTHTKNMDVINRVREGNATLITIPPHCSRLVHVSAQHILCLLLRISCLHNNPGMAVTQFQVSTLFWEAFLRASTPSTAVNGFRKCGICPFDSYVLQEADFDPSVPTDKSYSPTPVDSISSWETGPAGSMPRPSFEHDAISAGFIS